MRDILVLCWRQRAWAFPSHYRGSHEASHLSHVTRLVYHEWSRRVGPACSHLPPCEPIPPPVLLAYLSAHRLLLIYPLKSTQESVPFPNASLYTTYLNLSNVLVQVQQPHLVQLQPLNPSQSISISTRVKKIARPKVSPNSILPSIPPSYARVPSATLLIPRAHQRMRLCISPIAQGFRGVCSGVVMKKGRYLMPSAPRSPQA
jgi:hypothetical protein